MLKRRPLFNLPNALTLSRFFFAPVMLYLVLHLRNPEQDPDAWKTSLAALIVLTVTLLTDLFDGLVARARHEVTNFGKIMDPVADSTFFMTLFFGLSTCARFDHWISLWYPILVLYREVAMHILRRYAALKGHAMPAKMSGKFKMFTQSVAIAAFLLMTVIRDMTWNPQTGAAIAEDTLGRTLFWIAVYTVAINVLSLIEYSRDIPELIAEYTQVDGEARK